MEHIAESNRSRSRAQIDGGDHFWNELSRQVRSNPKSTLALAVGAGYLLERTRLLQVLGGALVSTFFSGDDLVPGDSDRHLTREERQLLAWLNDAYAMEKAQVPILKNHAEDARRHPQVRERDLQHLKQTKQHARDLERCIAHLGRKPSVTKKVIGRITGGIESMATEPFEDEIMKNFLMDYATENFEIASYRALIVAANEAGHPGIAAVCEKILEEEEEMAGWIEEHLPMAVEITMT
jgi:ferritin-like metal-binding protein YciE